MYYVRLLDIINKSYCSTLRTSYYYVRKRIRNTDLFFGNISDSFGKKVTLGLFPRCLQPVKSTLFQVPRHEGSGPECQRASGRPERSGRWIQSRVCHSWPIPVCEKWGSKNVGVKHPGAYFPFLQKPAFPLMGEIVGLWPLYKMKASPFHSFNAPQTLLLDI